MIFLFWGLRKVWLVSKQVVIDTVPCYIKKVGVMERWGKFCGCKFRGINAVGHASEASDASHTSAKREVCGSKSHT